MEPMMGGRHMQGSYSGAMSHAEKSYSDQIKQNRLLREKETAHLCVARCPGWETVHLTFHCCPFLIAAKHHAVTGQALQSPRGAASGTGGSQGTIRETACAQRTSWPCGWTDARAPGSGPAVLPTGKWVWTVREGSCGLASGE